MQTRKRGVRTPKEPSHTVSFRVDARTWKRLEREADSYNLSAGAYARKVMTDALEDHHRAQMLETATETQQQITKLRSDVATALEMVLLNLTTATKDEVRAWITKNLRE